MQPAMVDELPDWMRSEEYLNCRKSGKTTGRVGPAPDPPEDEVRATYGSQMGVNAIDRNTIGWNGFENYDFRTQMRYPAKRGKNRQTGK
ncbi:MAG: hypothetical protein ABIK12_16990 [Pseudomonadota bacterium]